jgi:hypothetical protein
MSSLAFLVTELQVLVAALTRSSRGLDVTDAPLQSLASESRRKYPEIREVRQPSVFLTSLAHARTGSGEIARDPQVFPGTSHSLTRIWWVRDSCAFVFVVSVVSFVEDGAQSDDLLRPVFMGCATKNAKVVAISLGSLQRLIALKAVPQSAVPLIINTMSDAMSQGVDIQLRILQTLVSLITNFPSVNGGLLGEVGFCAPILHKT